MRDVLELRPLEVFPGVVGVLDHVVGGVGLDQPDDPLDAVEWRGGAAGLEDDPTTDILRSSHISLATQPYRLFDTNNELSDRT